MALTLKQFADVVVQTGIVSAKDISVFERQLRDSSSNTESSSAVDLARDLIRTGRLTHYQATLIIQGRGKGLVFGEYTVLDKLGQGGMGVVFKARHRKLKRLVALKVLSAGSIKSTGAVRRFRRELEAAARLAHPNIVTAYDAGEHEGTLYLAMEYVEGKDLAAQVRGVGPIQVRTAVEYVLQAARGLAYAHAQGIVHRDIKPSNLFLDRRGTIKVLDMGLARIDLESQAVGPAPERLTDSGEVMGTCDYMAPEQAESTRRANERSDIYSLGCTLYCLLTGKPPYRGETLVQILLAHRDAPIPSPSKVVPGVPANLDAIFHKMVAKRPEERYQSMDAVIGVLETWLRTSSSMPSGGLDLSPPRDKGVAETLRQIAHGWTRASFLKKAREAATTARRRWLAGLLVLGCSMATVALIWMLTHAASGAGKQIVPGTEGAQVSEAGRSIDPFPVNGWKASWCPDGNRIAFTGLPVLGNPSRVDLYILDLRTGKITTLVENGQDPAWSPKDDRLIAYVRGQMPQDEVWLVNTTDQSTGKISDGGFPSWSADGRTLFFQSRKTSKLMAIDLGTGVASAAVKELVDLPWLYPAVSPDGRLVTYRWGDQAVVIDQQTGQQLKSWGLPPGGGYLPAWSPDGRHVGFGGFGGRDDDMGLWILDGESGEAVLVASGPATMPAWSPDGSKLAFDVRSATGFAIRMIQLRDFVPRYQEDWRTETKGRFTGRSQPAALAVQRALPSLVKPPSGAVLENGSAEPGRKRRVTWEFGWSEIPGARRYHLYVKHPSALAPRINDSDLTSASFRHVWEGWVPNVNRKGWRWRVRALVENTWTDWSEEGTFEVEPAG